jgi:hypothetical protein
MRCCEVSGSSEREIARWTGFMTQFIILKENKHQLLHVTEQMYKRQNGVISMQRVPAKSATFRTDP